MVSPVSEDVDVSDVEYNVLVSEVNEVTPLVRELSNEVSVVLISEVLEVSLVTSSIHITTQENEISKTKALNK